MSKLGRILHSIGFRYSPTNVRKRLMELQHVVHARTKFLREYMHNQQNPNPLPCVYLDETWIFENGSVVRSWQDDSVKSIRTFKIEGKR